MTLTIGARVRYHHPNDPAPVMGTIVGEFRTSYGDEAFVIDRDDGRKQRVCADRVRLGRLIKPTGAPSKDALTRFGGGK